MWKKKSLILYKDGDFWCFSLTPFLVKLPFEDSLISLSGTIAKQMVLGVAVFASSTRFPVELTDMLFRAATTNTHKF